MQRKVITVVLLLVGIAGSAMTTEAVPAFRFDPGTQTKRPITFPNEMQGYKGFKDLCKKCHSRKGVAPFLYAEKKSMRGWNRVFYTRYPKCARDGSWDSVDADTLLAINDYLYQYSYDAYDPYDAASCG